MGLNLGDAARALAFHERGERTGSAGGPQGSTKSTTTNVPGDQRSGTDCAAHRSPASRTAPGDWRPARTIPPGIDEIRERSPWNTAAVFVYRREWAPRNVVRVHVHSPAGSPGPISSEDQRRRSVRADCGNDAPAFRQHSPQPRDGGRPSPQTPMLPPRHQRGRGRPFSGGAQGVRVGPSDLPEERGSVPTNRELAKSLRSTSISMWAVWLMAQTRSWTSWRISPVVQAWVSMMISVFRFGHGRIEGATMERTGSMENTEDIMAPEGAHRSPSSRTVPREREPARMAPRRTNDLRERSPRDPTAVFVYRGGRAPRNVVRVRIHPSMRAISEGAFKDCRDLTSVEFHEDLEEIGMSAFRGCSSLRSLRIFSSVVKIGSGAFQDCTGLESVEFHEGLVKIGGLQRIPSSETEIEEEAFSGCTGLESIDFHTLRKIGRGAFRGCSSLGSLRLPSSVAVIGPRAFACCANLASVELHDGLRAVGCCAFWGCSSLRSLRIPSSVAEIEEGAFWNCTGLESIELHGGLRKIGRYAFRGCSSLGSLSVPSSVTQIGDGAFKLCMNLSAVGLRGGLQAVGGYVFRGCNSLERIGFPHLSERMEAIALDGELATEFENRMDEISRIIRKDSSNWKHCRESLRMVHNFLTRLELMEIALWKMKSEAEPRLSREECRITCGANIAMKEVTKFLLCQGCKGVQDIANATKGGARR